jgi:hypothetical protein
MAADLEVQVARIDEGVKTLHEMMGAFVKAHETLEGRTRALEIANEGHAKSFAWLKGLFLAAMSLAAASWRHKGS